MVDAAATPPDAKPASPEASGRAWSRRWRWYRRRLVELAERTLPFAERVFERRRLVSADAEVHGGTPRLHPPRTFNEKIVAASLADHHPLLTLASDKIAVRDDVAQRIGTETLLPLLGVWSTARDIPWERLTEPFVLKASHASGFILKVETPARLDRDGATRTAGGWLAVDFYRSAFREWRYRDIPPRLFAQPLLPGEDDASPQDHSVFCFEGEPQLLKIVAGRHGQDPLRISFHDWGSRRYLPFAHNRRLRDPTLVPSDYPWEDLERLVRPLAQDFDFVRVDVLRSQGRFWFGELTFTDNAGRGLFDPPEWDERIGGWWPLRDGTARFVRPGLPPPPTAPTPSA